MKNVLQQSHFTNKVTRTFLELYKTLMFVWQLQTHQFQCCQENTAKSLLNVPLEEMTDESKKTSRIKNVWEQSHGTQNTPVSATLMHFFVVTVKKIVGWMHAYETKLLCKWKWHTLSKKTSAMTKFHARGVWGVSPQQVLLVWENSKTTGIYKRNSN